MRDKVIEIIKTMREQAAIDHALGEKRCSFYLNDYAGQLAAAIGYAEGRCGIVVCLEPQPSVENEDAAR